MSGWVRRGAVLVWNFAPELPPPPRVVDLSTLIACPTCRAKVTQTCRTPSGHTRTPHADRLAPRLCPCGLIPSPGCVMCRFCAPESIQRSKNEHGRRRRAAAKVTA